MSNRKTKGIKPNAHIPSLKVTIESSSTKNSFEIFPAYLSNTLLNLNFDITPTVTVNDWNETGDAIRIVQLSKKNYLLYIVGDCLAVPYMDLDSAVFDLVDYVRTTLLAVLPAQTTGTIQ